MSQAEHAHSSKSVFYYFSLEDSCAVGDQPNPENLPSEAGPTAGYTAYVAKREKLRLVNFGCGRRAKFRVVELHRPMRD